MNSTATLHTTPSPDALYLGMDVGGTKCAALLGNATGEVLDRREWPSRVERGPQAMIDDFLAYARTAPRVVAAGVAIGGPLNAIECGIILSGNSFVNNTTKGERDPRCERVHVGNNSAMEVG